MSRSPITNIKKKCLLGGDKIKNYDKWLNNKSIWMNIYHSDLYFDPYIETMMSY